MQIIFSFWSFEISEGILRNQKLNIGLDSFSNHRIINVYLALLDNTRLFIDYHVEKVQVGNDQEMAQSERNPRSINFARGLGKKLKWH